jgi:hypothetical protein
MTDIIVETAATTTSSLPIPITDNVILSIVNKIPVWFLCLIIALYLIHLFCDKNIKLITKILLKQKVREERKDREQDNRLDNIDKDIKEIKNNQKDILEILTKPNMEGK